MKASHPKKLQTWKSIICDLHFSILVISVVYSPVINQNLFETEVTTDLFFHIVHKK